MSLLPAEDQVFSAVIPNPCVVEIIGSDASKVINNLCTNDILKLERGRCVESFVTDSRGWVVAHVMVLKQQERILLLGSHPQPERVCSHIDRYIIREDAKVGDLSSMKLLVLIDGSQADSLLSTLTSGKPISNDLGFETNVHHIPILAVPFPITTSASIVLVCEAAQFQALTNILSEAGARPCPSDELEFRRIANFWPFSPQDIREKTIPQELDRDAQAINFHKGCYLGQETIARLDARGQLQKKLCLVEILSVDSIDAGESIFNGDKEVGQLTSVAKDQSQARTLGLALLRRGNFEPGTELFCKNSPLSVKSP